MTLDQFTDEQLAEISQCCQQYGDDQGGNAFIATTQPFNQGQVACFYFSPDNTSGYTGNADAALDPLTICDAVPQEISTKPLNSYLVYILIAVVFVGGLWALKKYKVL